MNSNRRPGDIILDRYLSNARPEKREEARENLRRFARLLIRVHERRAREKNAIRANVDPALESESRTT
jgi:hypothetical protein